MHTLVLLICIMCFLPKGMNLRSNVSMAQQASVCVVVMVVICTPASTQLNCYPNITVGSCTCCRGLVQYYVVTEQDMFIVVLF